MSMVNFLVARVTEDEAVARDDIAQYQATPGEWPNMWPSFDEGVGTTPDRVLAECKAKRGLIRLHKNRNPYRGPDECDNCYEETYDPHDPIERALYPCQTLRVLAAVYADHPDYLEEWRPL